MTLLEQMAADALLSSRASSRVNEKKNASIVEQVDIARRIEGLNDDVSSSLHTAQSDRCLAQSQYPAFRLSVTAPYHLSVHSSEQIKEC